MNDWLTRGFNKRGERLAVLEDRVTELEEENVAWRKECAEKIIRIGKLKVDLLDLQADVDYWKGELEMYTDKTNIRGG